MIKRHEYSENGSPMVVEYVDKPPPRRLNTFYLLKMGFEKGPNNSYIRNDMTIQYDGVHWTCFYQAAGFEVSTVEEVEKIINNE